MGLLKNLLKWGRGKSIELSEHLVDPVRDGKLTIQDASVELDRFEKSIINLMAYNDDLERRMISLEREIVRAIEIAKAAAKAGNKKDVEFAVRKRANAQLQIDTLAENFNKNKTLINQMREQLEAATAKLNAAQADMACLGAREQAAKVRAAFADAASVLKLDKAGISSLNDFRKTVEHSESVANATEELHGTTGENLEEKYDLQQPNIKAEVQHYMDEAAGKVADKSAPKRDKRRRAPC